MASINVNRNVSDIFYRYKMPKLLAKVEGKGNGIKTVIVNMAEIAKALGRPPTYPTKYFGCELGAQTQFDFKNERFIVNGSHDSGKLQDLLDGFIRKFVLCPECENPETDLIVSTKRNTISQGCKACGYHGLLDTNHKLVTFILKNPPNLNPAVQGSSLTEGKRSKRSKKTTTNGDSTANGDVQQLDDSTTTTNNNTIEQNNSVLNDSDAVAKTVIDDNDDKWTLDVSEAAVRARMQDLTDGAKNITINDDLEKSEKKRMDDFYKKVETKRNENLLEMVTTQKELLQEAKRVEIKPKVPLILAELLLDENIVGQVKKYRTLFLYFTHNDTKAQKYLLGGLEQVIALHRKSLMTKVPLLLKLLYDLDILCETVILEWSEKASSKYVSSEVIQELHKNAMVFIKWLKEADTEDSDDDDNNKDDEEDDGIGDDDDDDDNDNDDDDDDSDNDLKIEYDDRSTGISIEKKIPIAVVEQPNSEDDVDIDAI